MKIILPFPPKDLNPNKRLFWAKKAKVVSQYRTTCFYLTKEVLNKFGDDYKLTKPLLLTLDFYPPDSRRRDDDNLIAAFKSGRDGIAQALGIDDNNFVTCAELKKFDMAKKNIVVVTIGEKNEKGKEE